ncbi:MAG: WxcM-like domain-containing protein [Bacteroidia bacterium]|nr:WxcM-like domain-containing protein [Bacteroidia bacterium]
MIPSIITGECFEDNRGKLLFNNTFNTSAVKRIYIIENYNLDFERGWQGHKIEQRWILATSGSFKIRVLNIDFFEKPNSDIQSLEFTLDSKSMNVLHVPPGYLTAIKSLELNSKLLLMSDYMLNEINDEIRYPII